MKTKMLALLAIAAIPAVSITTNAQSIYIGNSLSTNGGPGGPPPLVILGEYSHSSPLAASSPGTTLTSGVVQDVKFYGQNYDFTLYALSLVANGPNTNEQAFRVVASEYFIGSTTNPTAQSLPASGFVVHAGDLLAFAGIGPYCATNANDTLNSDATYEDSAYPSFLTATPPAGSEAVIIVGLNGDAGANYEYIPDTFGNQGRTYAIGVDVTSSLLTIAAAADGAVQVTVTKAATTPGIDTYFTALQADTNLNSSSWMNLTNFAVGATGGEFVDSAAAQYPSRFYRAQMLPFTVTNGIITTVAGGVATSNLAEPYGVTVDSSGNLFIPDPYNSVIRELSTNGTFSIVAGNGITGFSGDGGPATNASLNLIAGNAGVKTVAVDAAGNIFIPDKSNNRIRKVNTNGIITTLAGNGTVGYAGDGGPATAASLVPDGPAVDAAGNVFIADVPNNRIREIDTNGIITTVAGTGVAGYGGDGGLATNAKLNSPVRVALGPSGSLLIADWANQRIRKVNTTGIITTVTGNGTAGYSGDGGLAVNAELSYPDDVVADASGNVFIADFSNQRIRKVNTNGIISTVAGNGTAGYLGDGGPAVDAELSSPIGVAVDTSGNLFIADNMNERIRKVSGGVITTILGNGQGNFSGDGGPATKAALDRPLCTALDASGNLFIADEANNRIRKVDTNGIITTVAGTGVAGFEGDGGAATNAGLNTPDGVAVDGDGNVFFSDAANQRIRQIGANGNITTFAGNGIAGFSGDGGPATNAELNYPNGICRDAFGNLFIADTPNCRIRKVNTNGIISLLAGDGTYGYLGDGGPAVDAELATPTGVAADASGNVYIADLNNNRVRKVNTNGIISTVAGNGTAGYKGDGGKAISAQLYGPQDVAADSFGNLFIADSGNGCMRMVNSNGIISTVAGRANGLGAYPGDGGLATGASLNLDACVAVDAAGNVFISDTDNHRIRKVTKP